MSVERDDVYERLIKELRTRSAVGQRKYGVTVAAAPLSRQQWLQHLKEELLDASAYTQRLIDMDGMPQEAPPTEYQATKTIKLRWRMARWLLRFALRIAPDGSAACALEDILNDWEARYPQRPSRESTT